MKIRLGHVSNSSSSSFVVLDFDNIKCEGFKKYLEKTEPLFIFENLEQPTLEFGWEETEYDRFEDKVCWAFIQAQYKEGVVQTIDRCNPGQRRTYMLFKLLEEKLGRKVICTIDTHNHKWDHYIDHQSTIGERPCNDDIFESEINLENFLFNDNSYIQGGNDN